MSISGISTSLESIRQSFQQMRENGGISRDDLAGLQEQVEDAELAAGLSEFTGMFDTIDVDGSGKLEESEMAEYSRSAGMRPPPGGPPHGGGEPPALTQEELAQRADETGDSALSAASASFDEADTNQDGKVSFAEFQAFCEAQGITPQKPQQPESLPVKALEPAAAEEQEEENGSSTRQISSQAFQAILRAYWSRNLEDAGALTASSMKVEA